MSFARSFFRRWLRRAPPAPSPKRLVVCVPSGGHPTLGFTYSLANFFMTIHNPQYGLSAWQVAMVFGDGSVIHDNREQLAGRALAMKATHVLYLDDDMTFPPEAIVSLMHRNLPFVASNYTRRKPPHVAVASRADLTGLIMTTAESTGLVPAHGTGFGMALIASEVFAAIPKPWFMPMWEPDTAMYHSEDVMFCRRALAAGFQLQIDQDASKLLGHCSEQVLTCEHMAMVQAFNSTLEPRRPNG